MRYLMFRLHLLRRRCSGFGLLAWFALALALLPALPSQAQQGRRVALVIGNAGYAAAPLRNAGNDAQDLSARLVELGFEVTTLIDRNRTQMTQAIRAFGQQAQGADAALFYFAGHGVQVRGRNFLLPVGSRFADEAEVETEAVDVNAVLARLEEAGARVSLLILDACRNNPLPRSSRSGGRGLARMEAPSGALVAFAAQPGAEAQDGPGRNGTYTKHLLAHIGTPGLTVEQMFKRVRAGVERETGRSQSPREESSLTADFYFANPSAPAAAARPTSAQAPPPASEVGGRVFLDCAGCPEMVVIGPGSFLMGSPDGEAGRDSREGPQRRVVIAKPFALATKEVSRGEWKAVMGSLPAGLKPCGDNCPVEYVSWDDAQDFIARLNRGTGQNYRLPTEAEWEYAARAGTTTRYHTGNTITTEQANFNGAWNFTGGGVGRYRESAVPVGGFKPNSFGLYDMHGNVSEWVQDCAEGFTYRANVPTDGGAFDLAGCKTRVIRGGDWLSFEAQVRSARRNWSSHDYRNGNIGLRVARSLR